MFRLHLRRQWQAYWSEKRSLISLGLYIFLALWALAGGINWHLQMINVVSKPPADMITDRDTWLADLERVESGETVSAYAARPMAMTFLAVQAPSSLASLAYRHESIHPHATLINGWRNESTLFRRYEVQGASALRAGQLDLAFLVTVIFPLILIILCFDIVTREKESGRLRLYLSQGGSVVELVFARLFVVVTPLMVVPMLCVLAAALAFSAPFGHVLIWLSAMFVYALFWCGVVACVALWSNRSTSAALGSFVVWALIAVLLPSTVQFSAQALYPLPSRVSFLSEARDAEAATRRNLDQRAEAYMAEHPDLVVSTDSAVPAYYRAAYLANIDVNNHTAPLIRAAEEQRSSQRRFVKAVGFLSPALVVQGGIEAASGTGVMYSAAFRRQARSFLNHLLNEIGPATVNASRISSSKARKIPEFIFEPPRVPLGAYFGLVWVGCLGLFLLIIAKRKASHVS